MPISPEQGGVPEVREVGKNRERLLELEGEGKYVFHGSLEDIDTLEPQQAHRENKETGEMEKDGDPAVFGTPHADLAIFRALTNSKLPDSRSSFGTDDEGKLQFSATKNILDEAEKKIGKIYVLDKDNFEDDERGMESRSEVKNTPIEVIEVTTDDLSPDVQVIEE
jgi:hypothetical protein